MVLTRPGHLLILFLFDLGYCSFYFVIILSCFAREFSRFVMMLLVLNVFLTLINFDNMLKLLELSDVLWIYI